MEERDALNALGAHAHLDPSSPMICTPPSCVESIKTALTEEVLALVTEENGIVLIALHTDLQLRHALGLLFAHGFELADEVAIAIHQVPEVLDVLHAALLLDGVGIVPQCSLQNMHQVGLVLDVHTKNPLHLQDIVHRLDQRIFASVLNSLLNFPSEDARQQVLDPESHNRLPMRDWLLHPCCLKHLAVLVVMRMLPGRLLRACVGPIYSAFRDVLVEIWRQGFAPKGFANPHEVLIGLWIEANVANIFLQGRFLAIGAEQDAVDDDFVVRALLEGDLDLVTVHSEGTPWTLIEEAKIAILMSLDHLQELIPDLGNAGIPLKNREILRNWTFR
mmetsp:Transcript_90460/g.198153  ORF Transcript_90460/g.198153 Transcript_90460/m.198153 type:complete len:333 (-) Transcript_90460:475-1473(-)